MLIWAFKCIQMLKNWPSQTDFWPVAKILIENPVDVLNKLADLTQRENVNNEHLIDTKLHV